MLSSGFFNALRDNNNLPDRTYKAEDYCDNLALVISDGVLRSATDDFKPTLTGMTLGIGPGRGFIKGHWVYNDNLANFNVPTAAVGYNRYDRLVLRLDTNIESRAITMVYLTGTPGSAPVAPALTRTDLIWEICIAEIYVPANSTAPVLTDTRSDASVCGWVYSTSGDGSFFVSLDNQFDVWFEEVRDSLSTTTTEVEYKQYSVLTSATNQLLITIPQYDSTINQKIEIYVNGIRDASPSGYSITDNLITFTNQLTAGTAVEIIITIGKDGSGIPTVVEDVTDLQNRVAALEGGFNQSVYNYICNGTTDNVALSTIAQTWLNGGTDYGSLKVNIYGTLGITAPNAGTGTSANPYQWFSLGAATAKNRRIIFDFSGASQATITCADGTYNIVFYGASVDIIGANIIATGGRSIIMFPITITNNLINAERCRFWITSQAGVISTCGTFRDCRGSITSTSYDSYCFNVISTGGILRVFGGEYYSYAPTGSTSSVVYVGSSQTTAVSMTYGMNCPAVSRSGYVQSYAINCLPNNAKHSYTDTITSLPITAAGQNIRGTLNISKPGAM